MEDLRIKISILWLSVVAILLAKFAVALLEPGVISRIMEGEYEGQNLGPEILLASTILFLIPLAMAFLSLTLKSSLNRWTNVILGAFFFISGLPDIPGSIAESSAHSILLDISVLVTTALIVWIAWTSKRTASP